jgi:hypothetical protein
LNELQLKLAELALEGGAGLLLVKLSSKRGVSSGETMAR